RPEARRRHSDHRAGVSRAARAPAARQGAAHPDGARPQGRIARDRVVGRPREMPTVRFTRRLWSRAGGRGELPLRSVAAPDRGRLRAWAVSLLETPVGDFVVGLEEATYLTVLCPLLPLPDFYRAFAASFAAHLDVLGVAGDVVEAEVDAFIGHPRPAKNDNRRLLGSLNDVAFNAFA